LNLIRPNKLTTFSRINFEAKTMHVECGTPEIVMAFDYEFKGRILLLPIKGKGPGSVTIGKNVH
jgi:hypothetical protein